MLGKHSTLLCSWGLSSTLTPHFLDQSEQSMLAILIPTGLLSESTPSVSCHTMLASRLLHSTICIQVNEEYISLSFPNNYHFLKYTILLSLTFIIPLLAAMASSCVFLWTSWDIRLGQRMALSLFQRATGLLSSKFKLMPKLLKCYENNTCMKI